MAVSVKLSTTTLCCANSTAGDRRKRLPIFLAWLLLVAWLLSAHVFWRDEVRAFALALSGAHVSDMLRNIHGEGHPALWYLILRGAYDVFPSREVLPFAGALVGIAAMSLFAFRAPFRIEIIALVLFSLFGAFEYVVVARNYGISALVMFALATFYPRVRNTPVFGLMLAVLCNTNVPSCILAGAFLLFRLVEMLANRSRLAARDWLMLIANAAIALTGVILCFLTVYPPLNDGALSSNFGAFSAGRLLSAIGNGGKGFSNLVLNLEGWIAPILLWTSCLAFIRKPAALAAALGALLGLKLFFYFIYPSAYRHEALFIVFLLSLLWMGVEEAGGSWRIKPWMDKLESLGTIAILILLVAQVLDLAKPLYLQSSGIPYSRSSELAALLQRQGLSSAIVTADPDVMLEPLPYYMNNPMWFMREKSFGPIFLRTSRDRRQMSLDDVLADVTRLHAQSGRPVVFLSHFDLRNARSRRIVTMYGDSTTLTPDTVTRFLGSTRLIARLRPAISDEAYDVYVYPS